MTIRQSGRKATQPFLALIRSPARRGIQLLDADTAQLKKPDKGFFDQVVGAGRAGRDPDHDRPFGQPFVRDYFATLVQIEVENFLVRDQPAGVKDEIGRQLFFAHLGQVRGVGAVVAADDQQQIHGHAEQLAQGILPLLRCAADGVKKRKFGGLFRAVAIAA